MQIAVRNNSLIFNQQRGDDGIKKHLRYMQYNHVLHKWLVPATLASFVDAYKAYGEQAFMLQDKQTAAFVAKNKMLVPRLEELQSGLDSTSRDVVLPSTIDYVWEPFQHQKEALAFALNLNKCALWLDMGLGKTYTSITLAKLRHADVSLGGVHTIVVVAPKSLLYQWKAEISTLIPGATVINFNTLSKTKLERAVEEAATRDFIWYLTTYESAQRFSNFTMNMGIKLDMFILDEATKIKSPKAKRSEATIDLVSDIPYGVELTGMAYVNSPLDLFSQFRALDKSLFGDNQWVFSNRYISYVQLPFGKVIDGYKHMDELKQRSYLYAFSRTKAQCLGLPEKVYNTRKLQLNQAQYDWYENLLEQILKEDPIDEDKPIEEPLVTVEYVVAMLEKFQQITSGFIVADTGEYIDLGSEKYDELLEIIKSSKDSFIIWARHTYTIRKIERILAAAKLNFETLTRAAKEDTRRYVKDKFKNGDLKILILQIQSECRGNDFTCSNSSVTAIFFENTASIEERAQAEDRQHRIGMTGTAVYIDLVCEDTYDEGIQKLLASKKNLSEYIREQKLDLLVGHGGTVSKAKTKGAKKHPKSPYEIESEKSSMEEFQKDWDTHIDGFETL